MKKIAVIDDNDDVLFTIKFGITNADKSIKVDTYNTPQAFLEAAKKERYDLILLDIMMPEMDGWDTFVEITTGNHLNKKTPIVFLTAKTDQQSRAMGSAGAKDYLTKPFTIPDLLEKIKQYIGK